jgi:hypothetical protein
VNPSKPGDFQYDAGTKEGTKEVGTKEPLTKEAGVVNNDIIKIGDLKQNTSDPKKEAPIPK